MQDNNIVIPGISLCQKWGKIRIFHSTIVALGEPRYIRFLFNLEMKKLAVQACARKEAECFCVPKYDPENWEFKISTVRYNAKRFENSKFAYRTRLCMIAEQYMESYAEIWYYRFWQGINNVWDEKNTWGFLKKIRYCNCILTSTEFRECYNKIDKESINKIYLKLIKKGNYL